MVPSSGSEDFLAGRPYFTPSHLPSVTPSRQASSLSPSLMSHAENAMIDELEVPACVEARESFNVLCAGESGLGKSTFLRDIFAHLDPSKLQDLRKAVTKNAKHLETIQEELRRNDQESRSATDERARQLRDAKVNLKAKLAGSSIELEAALQCFHDHQRAVRSMRTEEEGLVQRVAAQRARARNEDDDAEAKRLLDEVLLLGAELATTRETLKAELRRPMDKDQHRGQTREVTLRYIKSMPLYAGAAESIDVTLIDTPGFGDFEVDLPGNSCADKVVAEVKRRITNHLRQDVANKPGLALVDEKKFWNELVHLCIFFITPHRMKRADVALMRRLHTLVPLVVVIAKSDTMTVDETRAFKGKVRDTLQKQGISTFVFQQAKRTSIEDEHKTLVAEKDAAESARPEEDFQPLYGGSEGDQPWAVMAADDSRRKMIIGTWDTSNPRHSDLPALRDLLLKAGGWQDLKADAARKAEAEGVRRARKSWMLPRSPTIVEALLVLAILALLAAMLVPTTPPPSAQVHAPPLLVPTPPSRSARLDPRGSTEVNEPPPFVPTPTSGAADVDDPPPLEPPPPPHAAPNSAEAQIDEVDCAGMKLKDLRQWLASRGLKCDGCVEKADYVSLCKQNENEIYEPSSFVPTPPTNWAQVDEPPPLGPAASPNDSDMGTGHPPPLGPAASPNDSDKGTRQTAAANIHAESCAHDEEERSSSWLSFGLW